MNSDVKKLPRNQLLSNKRQFGSLQLQSKPPLFERRPAEKKLKL